MVEPHRKIAVLIDADNATPSSIPKLLEDLSALGDLLIRRAYGDWAGTNMGSWKKIESTCAVQLIQQSRYIKGKNATDMALVIDAMDLLYWGKVDTFCLVSSDSDFTPLAIRLRNAGRRVIGVGTEQTNEGFINACTEFVTINSSTEEKSRALSSAPATNGTKASPIALLKKAYQGSTQQNGWVLLTHLGQSLHLLDAEFKPNKYGHSTLGKMVRAYPELFEVKGEQANVCVRLKS